jgi:hypothetical protein
MTKLKQNNFPATFGKLIFEFESENKQVKALLFEKNGVVEAFVELEKNLRQDMITDKWISILNEKAKKETGREVSKIHFVE